METRAYMKYGDLYAPGPLVGKYTWWIPLYGYSVARVAKYADFGIVDRGPGPVLNNLWKVLLPRGPASNALVERFAERRTETSVTLVLVKGDTFETVVQKVVLREVTIENISVEQIAGELLDRMTLHYQSLSFEDPNTYA